VANPNVVEAAGVLLLTRARPRQFLLMRHPDRWDLPKGHAEPGESARQTALRETSEETGLGPAAIALEPDFQFHTEYEVRYADQPDPPRTKRLTIFLGWIDRPREIACTEHSGYRWWPWSPPHAIQPETIDPLLSEVARYLAE